MSWDKQLQRAKFGDFAFDCQTTTDDVDPRIIEHIYPWKGGSKLEFLGAGARPTNLRAVFLGESSETDVDELRALAEKGETAIFTHPLLGTWDAKITRASIVLEHSFRDGAVVDVSLKADGIDQKYESIFSIEKVADDLGVAATLVETESSLIEQISDRITAAKSQVADSVAEARAYATTVKTKVDGAIQGMNQVRAKAKKAVDLLRGSELSDLKSYDAISAIQAMSYSALLVAQSATSDKPPLRVYKVKANTPLAVIAFQLYGDASRTEELIEMNGIRNPAFIEAGSELAAFSE